MGLSDYPSTSQNKLEGGAVGLFVRYRCGRPRTQGGPFDLDSKHQVLRGYFYKKLAISLNIPNMPSKNTLCSVLYQNNRSRTKKQSARVKICKR